MSVNYFFLTSRIKNLNLKDKRVLLRADLNVPVKNGNISDAYRLRAIEPTINLLQKHGAKVILITHLGRPKGTDPQLSTTIIANWFRKKGYVVSVEPNLEKAKEKSFEEPATILLLENLRFFPEKDNYDETQRITFAKKLALLGDYFVQDAFAALHRHDTSVTLLPVLFDKDKRFIGPLVEKELQALDAIRTNPANPFVLIIGGGKIASKLPLIEPMLDKVQTILLCPAIVFTFLKYRGKQIGKSLVDTQTVPLVSNILQKAKKLGVAIIFPVDYQIAKDNFDGAVSYTDSDIIPDNSIGISIGTKTEKLFTQEIMKAKTVFFNGAFGNRNKEETLYGMKTLMEAMAKSKAFTVIGGGDSVAAAYSFKLENSINYLSTAGGSTLAYISGVELPGLKPFDA